MIDQHNVEKLPAYRNIEKEFKTVNRLIRNTPGNVTALVRLGRLYDFKSEFSSAAAQFKNALTALSLDSSVNDIDQVRAAVEKYNTSAGRVEQITVRSVSDLFNYWALSLKSLNNIDNALVFYGKAIFTDLTNATPFNNRGIVYMNSGENDLALKDFDESIRLNPKYAIPYCNRGIIKKSQGRRKEAEEDHRTAIALDKKFAEPCYNLGILYHEGKRYKEAVKVFKMAIKRNKKYALAYFNLGVAYSQINAPIRANCCIKKALKLEPDNPLILGALGYRRTK
ncbi:MAG: tetratricopeptide repeat protein [Treponema sp.]|nr:tetratricopeptide repeat protein [Treponema sp.]